MDATVTATHEYGVMLRLGQSAQPALLHASEISRTKLDRKKMGDYFKIGQKLKVPSLPSLIYLSLYQGEKRVS